MADFRLRAGDVVEHLLSEVGLIVEGAGSGVLDDVVEDAQAPLMVGPSVVGLLKSGSK